MKTTMNQGGLLALYTYNSYANKLVLNVIDQLTEQEFTQESSPSHGSVHELLSHIVKVEALFLAQCQGQALDWHTVDLSTRPSIRQYWSQVEQAQLAFIGSLNDAELARETSMRLRGQPFVLPLWQLLMQALIHAVHHRGELSIVLTELNHPLPTLDIIVHFIQESGQQWAN